MRKLPGLIGAELCKSSPSGNHVSHPFARMLGEDVRLVEGGAKPFDGAITLDDTGIFCILGWKSATAPDPVEKSA